MQIMNLFLDLICGKGSFRVNSSCEKDGYMKYIKALGGHTSAVIANAHTSLSAVALPPSMPSGAIQPRAPPTMGEVRVILNEGSEMNEDSNPVSNAHLSPAMRTLH